LGLGHSSEIIDPQPLNYKQQTFNLIDTIRELGQGGQQLRFDAAKSRFRHSLGAPGRRSDVATFRQPLAKLLAAKLLTISSAHFPLLLQE